MKILNFLGIQPKLYDMESLLWTEFIILLI